MLSLQARQVEHATAKAAILDSQSRVYSISLIHELLYKSNDLSRIDFKKYAQELTSNLVNSFSYHRSVAIQVESNDITLPIDKAIPCGLILNELITNALKHAFTGSKTGSIYISINKLNERSMSLSVSDNGIGLPEGVDIESCKTLGLRLISSLVAQLDGSLKLSRDVGTCVQIAFEVNMEGTSDV